MTKDKRQKTKDRRTKDTSSLFELRRTKDRFADGTWNKDLFVTLVAEVPQEVSKLHKDKGHFFAL